MPNNSQSPSYSLLETIVTIALAAIIGASLAVISAIYIWLLICISYVLAHIIVRLFFAFLAKIAKIDEESNPMDSIPYENPTPIIIQEKPDIFGAALNAINDPIVILDSEQRILIANIAARKKFPTFAIGARVETLIRTQEILDELEKVVANKSAIDFELIEHFPQKRYFQINVSAFLVAKEYNYIIAIKDETNLRAAEQMRADFLANVGHELRTPLAGISGFIETLSGPARNDAKARDKFLPIMQKQADRMGRLINDILSLTRIELNEHLKPKSQINLGETLEAMIATIKAAHVDKVPNIILNKPQNAVMAIGDEDEIAQVIINLLENAIKYSKSNTPIEVYLIENIDPNGAILSGCEKWPKANSLRIVALHDSPGQRIAMVRIENSGKGIEKQNMPRLSERFYRIESQTNEIAGTGLGLAIVKHIISRHGGILCVESEINAKTAFSFGLIMESNA